MKTLKLTLILNSTETSSPVGYFKQQERSKGILCLLELTNLLLITDTSEPVSILKIQTRLSINPL